VRKILSPPGLNPWTIVTPTTYPGPAQYWYKKESTTTQTDCKFCILSDGCVLCKHTDM